jgi:hypothetical protein
VVVGGLGARLERVYARHEMRGQEVLFVDHDVGAR